MRRYYIAPYTTLYAVGGGRFSLTDPGGARQVIGSRVLIHGVWLRDITRHYSETIKPTGARGRAKDMLGMSYVEAPDADPLNLHKLIQADSEIDLLPWTPDNLGDAFGALSAEAQSVVRSVLSSTFFDDQWISATRTFRDIMSYILHILFAAQQLGTDYPDGALTASLGVEKQTAINEYLAAFALPSMSGNPTNREVINQLAQADYGERNPRLGGEQFGAWSP